MTAPGKTESPELDALAADMAKATAEHAPATHALATVRSPPAETQVAALAAVNLRDDATFGQIMRGMIDAAGGDGAAMRDSLIHATRPGSPERAAQDQAWSLLTRRFTKLVKGDGE